MTNKFWSFAVTGVIAFLSLVGLGQAQEPYYQDKTIRILVGSSAGGTFDAYSRMIARHIGKHIPGNPKLIVENVCLEPEESSRRIVSTRRSNLTD